MADATSLKPRTSASRVSCTAFLSSAKLRIMLPVSDSPSCAICLSPRMNSASASSAALNCRAHSSRSGTSAATTSGMVSAPAWRSISTMSGKLRPISMAAFVRATSRSFGSFIRSPKLLVLACPALKNSPSFLARSPRPVTKRGQSSSGEPLLRPRRFLRRCNGQSHAPRGRKSRIRRLPSPVQPPSVEPSTLASRAFAALIANHNVFRQRARPHIHRQATDQAAQFRL